jgi:WD repeat-containing protein 32
VHDIQEVDVEDEEPPIPEILQNFDLPDGSETNSIGGSEVIPYSSNASNNSDTSNETSSNSDLSNRHGIIPNVQIDPPDDEANENEAQNQNQNNNMGSNNGGNGNSANGDNNEDEIHIVPYQATLRPSLINTEEILDLWTGNIPFYQRSRRTLTERPHRINTGILSMNLRNVRRPNIKQNAKRLLYYCSELNEGKGFIKELCFNNDGRLIVSPYKCGIRLLAFSKNCEELPFVLPSSSAKMPIMPQKLHEILVKPDQHEDIVVSTKFSPRAPICVSGCLRGTLSWYQPI